METREEKLQKLNEQLDDEQLDNVTGGNALNSRTADKQENHNKPDEIVPLPNIVI